MTTQRDASIAATAAAQHGRVSDAQAVAAGLSQRVIEHRVATGCWTRPHPGVIGLPGAPDTWLARLWAAALAVGGEGRIASEAAAALHRLAGYPQGRVVLLVAHPDHTRLREVTVHQTRHPWPDFEVIDGLRVTPLAATFVDLAMTSRPARVARALDDAWSARRVTPVEVGRRLQHVARGGRPGVRMLTAILDERLGGAAPSGSIAEAELHELVGRAGLPPLTRQFALPGRGGVSGLVDGAWTDAHVVVEVDSRRWHDRIAQRRLDTLRDQEAARVGWLTVRVLVEDIRNDPDGTVALLRDIRATRRAAA